MASPLTGQATGLGLGSPVPLSSVPVNCVGFVFKAPSTNSAAVYIGASTVSATSGFQLDPGEGFTYERFSQNGQPSYQLQASDFYMCGATGDKVVWLASPSP